MAAGERVVWAFYPCEAAGGGSWQMSFLLTLSCLSSCPKAMGLDLTSSIDAHPRHPPGVYSYLCTTATGLGWVVVLQAEVRNGGSA